MPVKLRKKNKSSRGSGTAGSEGHSIGSELTSEPNGGEGEGEVGEVSEVNEFKAIGGQRKGEVGSEREGEENGDEDTNNEIERLSSKATRTTTTTDRNTEGRRKKLEKSVLNSRRVIFFLGALLGMGFAIYYGANSNPDLIPDLDTLVNFDTVNGYLEDWRDVLPASLQGILNDAADSGSMRATTESFSVGKYLKEERNLTYKYPIVMVPGVISTGIESWGLEGTPECPSEPHFRKRLWGSFYMLRTMVLDKTCWLKHIMLDPETGLDPPGITLRAAQGFEASDFFMAGYWIWNKVLQNLAVIGYGPNNMVSASYDWRLSYLDLERRDGYFSKLKAQIEMHKKIGGEKSVLFSHSMGSQVIFYFMQWVEAEGEHYGNGGSTWVNDHIAAFVDISGSVLGTPKALVALLSGEMKDTVALNTLGVKGLEKFFSRRERVDMLKSFGGIASMIPKGGDLIWGDMNGAPDDNIPFDVNYNNETFGKFISFKENIGIFSSKNLTMTDSIEFLLDQSPKWFKDRTLEHYSFGISKNKDELIKNKKFFNKWANPLEVPLPNAPDLKIYCIYGVGNPTERSYIYQEEQNKQVSKLNVSIAIDHTENPVALSDGDGTISLLTHAMCHKWKEEGNNIYNPGNSKVTIVEIKHQPDRFDIRGGAKTAEHVDILGSSVLNELLLIIAAGKGDEIEDKYVSPLKDIVANIDF